MDDFLAYPNKKTPARDPDRPAVPTLPKNQSFYHQFWVGFPSLICPGGALILSGELKAILQQDRQHGHPHNYLNQHESCHPKRCLRLKPPSWQKILGPFGLRHHKPHRQPLLSHPQQLEISLSCLDFPSGDELPPYTKLDRLEHELRGRQGLCWNLISETVFPPHPLLLPWRRPWHQFPLLDDLCQFHL